MKNQILATAGIAALLTLGVALPAEAHTGDLHVTATCNTATGQYDFHSELVIGNAGNTPGTTHYRVGTSNFDGTPNSAANMPNSIPVTGNGTYGLADFSLPGTTTGKGPWVYAFTEFTNGVKVGSDGQLLTNLAGNCVQVLPLDASVSYSITPATCVAGETFHRGAAVNASFDGTTTADGAQGPGPWAVNATADAKHLFAGGSSTFTDSGVLAGPLDPNAAPCKPAPPLPKYKVEDTEGQPNCVTDKVTITHTEYESLPVWNTTTHVYEDGPFVKTAKVIADTTRPLDKDELAKCHPPTDIEKLAATGDATLPLGLSILAIIAILVVWLRVVRRKELQGA